ncbi:hypothetical protein ACFU96_48075 [Streptomyces sp. NPDC057620]|uniref:hypothetical protein n=1 Tax=Streptomyces sp. NPDC057620 TaxID=3346185 RepID=UPI003676696D
MTVAVVLLTAALVFVFALLAAAGAVALARIEGASYAAAVQQGAIAFTAVLTVAAAVTGARTDILT